MIYLERHFSQSQSRNSTQFPRKGWRRISLNIMNGLNGGRIRLTGQTLDMSAIWISCFLVLPLLLSLICWDFSQQKNCREHFQDLVQSDPKQL